MAGLLGEENFRLVFSDPTSESRQEMGWQDPYQAPYILRMWESDEAKQQVAVWIDTADVVVQGRFPMNLVRGRINSGKLTFAYQERFWKRPFSWVRVILRLPRIWRRYWSVNRPNYHLLAAGAYVAPDLAVIKCFGQRAWKFGYFIDHVDTPRTTSEKGLTILWCARFSPVKRAADALAIFRGLKANHGNARLLMVGDGEERAETEKAAKDIGDSVQFLGWQSAERVEALMLQADVFLMTSGFGEGWALVINEAVRAGCMVVANQEVGAAPWLIEHQQTGLLYDQRKKETVVALLAAFSKTQIQQMGSTAQELHRSRWSSRIAAERLVQLSAALLAGEEASELFSDGPCSPA